VENDEHAVSISRITVYDFIKHLWNWRRFIATVAAIFFCLGIVGSLLMPKIYKATATILPPGSQGLASNLSLPRSLPLDISPSILGLGSGKKAEIDRFITILQSTKLQRSVIDSFQLIDHYGFKERKKYFIEDVIKSFKRNTKLEASDEGSLSISVLDTSPRLACSMANFMVVMLDSINKDLARTQMGRKKEFLQLRMQDNREMLQKAEDSLMAFQKTTGIVEIKKQTEESIHAIGEAEAKLLVAGMECFIDSLKFSSWDPHVKEKLADFTSMRTYLSNITKEKGSGILLPLAQIPTNALSFERLLRRVVISNTLDQYLTKEYEAARLEEKSTIPTVAVLDYAFVPERKVKPVRSLVVLFVTGLGMGLGIVGSILFQSLAWIKPSSYTTSLGLRIVVQCARFFAKPG
jgi:tyrosine-protein kinase Etk/Wzc